MSPGPQAISTPPLRLRERAAGILTCLLGLIFLASAAGAQTLTFPPLTGRVVDEAGILDSGARQALTQKLAALEAKSTDQLVVATVKSLQGTSVEDYGNRLFRNWKLGQAGKNNGVLVLVAPNERKVRIEVGYGLEGTLTDAVSRLIIENGMLPRFRANDFPGGIARGVNDVIQVLTGDDAEWKQRAAATRPEHSSSHLNGTVVFFLFGVFLIVLFGFLNHAFPQHSTARMRSGRGRSNSYWDSSGSSWSSSGSSWSSSGSSSSSDSGFSGGGGDSGGGGASSSW